MMKTWLNLGILKYGISLLAFGILAGSLPLRSEESGPTVSHGGFGIALNGSDVGTILVKVCDLNRDGTVSLAELKQVAAACFKLWDLNKDGYLSAEELSSGLKQFFPAPPSGATRAMAVVNGVQIEVPPEAMPTPDNQLTKHIMALADSNKDGLISAQELNDFLDKNFSQWDRDANGSLSGQELGMAFGQLAAPDGLDGAKGVSVRVGAGGQGGVMTIDGKETRLPPGTDPRQVEMKDGKIYVNGQEVQ